MQLQEIELNKIEESESALRQVDRTSEKYIGLVDSIKQMGVLNPINVRAHPTKEGHYILIDGAHRFNGAKDAGLTSIGAQILTMDEMKVNLAQIVANIHKIETAHFQYSKQLMRILAQDPLLTSSQLAVKLGKSPAWLNDRLSLVKLPEDVGKLVDEGKIPLSNGYVLAKLATQDPTEVAAYLDRAITEDPRNFVQVVQNRIKELRDSKRQGRDASKEWRPTSHVRKKSETEATIANPQNVASKLGVKSVEDFVLGLQYAIHLDPISVDQARAKEEARKAQEKAESERRKTEREAKKQEEGIKIAADVLDK